MGMFIVFGMPVFISAGGLLILGVASAQRLLRRYLGAAEERSTSTSDDVEAARRGTQMFGASFLVALCGSLLNGYLFFVDREALALLHPGYHNELTDLQITCFINVILFAVSLALFKAGRNATE